MLTDSLYFAIVVVVFFKWLCLYIESVCMCVYVCIRVCVFKPECVCEGLRTTLGSVHSFHRYLGSVQVARLMWQVPLPAEPCYQLLLIVLRFCWLSIDIRKMNWCGAVVVQQILGFLLFFLTMYGCVCLRHLFVHVYASMCVSRPEVNTGLSSLVVPHLLF